ncbi:nucleotidyl transferase AbiEii/AbiGii toxin family protein [Bacillus sp. Brlt_9]|uniref:nucleotidyl transferase AbiEii/AbiGii toxin family protein n=1 Tax=Bacillus sp. Brlt_9 TaxID=3110916 RepID=UPI003F7C7C6F
MRLHEDKELFARTVMVVADEMGIPEKQVEKDYYVSFLLKKIIDRIPHIVFKGGTSLSKCFGVIHRFSEDIDITYSEEKTPNRKEKKKLKEEIIEAIKDAGLTLLNGDKIMSGHDLIKYEVDYESATEGYGEELRGHLLVETSARYLPFPCDDQLASNYIAEYFAMNERFDVIKEYELEPYPVKVQGVERTFIDKVFAIADYVEKQETNRNSRHLYDLHMIWNEYGNGFRTREDFKELIESIIVERRKSAHINISANEGYELLKKMDEIMILESYREDYEFTTLALVHKEKIPYNTVIETLREIMGSGLIPSVIKIDIEA